MRSTRGWKDKAAQVDSRAAREAWTEALDLYGPELGGKRPSDLGGPVRRVYVEGLLLLDRLDEAKPLFEEPYAKGWRAPDFLALAREKGLLPG